jgi:sporulation protein YlmC with PRC-barrel domain
MKNILRFAGLGLITLAVASQEPASEHTPAPAQKVQELSVDPNTVTAFNKASRVVGMTVKNAAGKDLGKVQELVFDLESQRLGYAVIALSASRIVPVPVTALKPAQDHFILNVSEAVLAAASGIAHEDWPGTDAFAVGGPAETETGKASSAPEK